MTGYRGRVQSGAVAGGRIARLLLLVCTLFGLAAMHTIGHGGVDHVSHHDEPQAAATGTSATVAGMAPVSAVAGMAPVSAVAGMTPVVVVAASGGCDCDHAAMQPLGGGGMAALGLCVAVLGALAVAVLLAALLLGALTGRYPPRTARGPGRRAPRAPPVPAFGLALATVSVLRT